MGIERKTTNAIIRNALFGAATGDALGVPVEFMSRKNVRQTGLRDMVGADTHPGMYGVWSKMIPAGAWSDDTSMALATMVSIAESGGKLDYEDVMRRFTLWWETGAYSSLDSAFGLGGCVSIALRNYRSNLPAIMCGSTDAMANGNGSLMRIFPISLYCIFNGFDDDTTARIINAASGLTHGHGISKMGCLIFTVFMRELLAQGSANKAWEAARKFDYARYYPEAIRKEDAVLLDEIFPELPDSVIGETGYVVDTLMGAVHSMLIGHDYESTILCAINLGYDTDTTGAVAGALAGVLYGADSIPERWLSKLLKRDMLENAVDKFTDSIYNA